MESVNDMRIKNGLMLLLTAFIWGTAFVAQSVGMDYLEPFTFNGVRSLIGGAALLPCIWILQKLNGRSKDTGTKKDLLTGGLACGVLLFAASSLQQIGIKYTTAGKAGFITAFYIVIVPVIGLFMKKKCSPMIWLSVLLAVVGLYLLCINEQFSIGYGDILVFVCAILFSVHILIVDYFSPKVDGVKMSCIQFFTCAVLAGIGMLLFEQPTWANILAAWKPILYAGAMSSGVAYTFQIIGQKGLRPTIASLIMSLESVISAISGWLLLGQALSAREIFGCVLMFGAIVLAQLPEKRRAQA